MAAEFGSMGAVAAPIRPIRYGCIPRSNGHRAPAAAEILPIGTQIDRASRELRQDSAANRHQFLCRGSRGGYLRRRAAAPEIAIVRAQVRSTTGKQGNYRIARPERHDLLNATRARI